MKQKVLSLRLDEELIDAIEKRASDEGKSKTDLVKELLQIGLAGSKEVEFGTVLSRIDSLESTMKELMTKNILSSAATRFYGKQVTTFMLDLGLHIQGKEPLTREEKLSKVEAQDKKASQYAEIFLNSEYKPKP